MQVLVLNYGSCDTVAANKSVLTLGPWSLILTGVSGLQTLVDVCLCHRYEN